MASLSLQWNAWKKLYITPTVSAASSLTSANPFRPDSRGSFLLGAGIDFDYLTLIGPVKLSYSINNEGVFYSFFSLGYQF